MIKQAIVSFDFDTETGTVTNVKCAIDGAEKKKRTTKKVNEIQKEMSSESLVTLEAAKLVFNNKAVADLGLTPESRVVIKYELKGKIKFPVIGTDVAWDEEGAGNKVTKTFTVQYKGKANVILAEYGSEFTLEPYKDGLFKLISKNAVTATKEIEEVIAKSIDEDLPELIVEGDENYEVDEDLFNL